MLARVGETKYTAGTSDIGGRGECNCLFFQSARPPNIVHVLLQKLTCAKSRLVLSDPVLSNLWPKYPCSTHQARAPSIPMDHEVHPRLHVRVKSAEEMGRLRSWKKEESD